MYDVESSPVMILVVDDDLGHCELIRRHLRRAAVSNPVVMVQSGEDALDFIHRRGPHEGRAGGGRLLVLLDINMPGGMNGIDLLGLLKADDQTSSLPVIMLTTTDDPHEIERCYALGCGVYVTKPVEPNAFIEAIRRIGLFIEIVRVAPVKPKEAA